MEIQIVSFIQAKSQDFKTFHLSTLSNFISYHKLSLVERFLAAVVFVPPVARYWRFVMMGWAWSRAEAIGPEQGGFLVLLRVARTRGALAQFFCHHDGNDRDDKGCHENCSENRNQGKDQSCWRTKVEDLRGIFHPVEIAEARILRCARAVHDENCLDQRRWERVAVISMLSTRLNVDPSPVCFKFAARGDSDLT